MLPCNQVAKARGNSFYHGVKYTALQSNFNALALHASHGHPSFSMPNQNQDFPYIRDIAENNELNRAESEFSKRETKNRLLGADIETDQINHSTLTFLRETSKKATTEEE